ncbi:MAG: hypothetical protein AABZ32_07055 [Bacteroidota bacterium]
MKNISIPVPPYIASAYKRADEKQRRDAQIYINVWLNAFFSKKSPDERLIAILKKAGAEAKAKGFTPDKLDELLKGDE